MLAEIIAFIVLGFFFLIFIQTPTGMLFTIIGVTVAVSTVWPPAAAIVGFLFAASIVYFAIVDRDEEFFFPAAVIVIAGAPILCELAAKKPRGGAYLRGDPRRFLRVRLCVETDPCSRIATRTSISHPSAT